MTAWWRRERERESSTEKKALRNIVKAENFPLRLLCVSEKEINQQ
jgi:hypothetical protein